MNIGFIGLGDMGRLYAKAFAKAGYTVCGAICLLTAKTGS
jgi:prephenate dehydrogenase (NADP+)